MDLGTLGGTYSAASAVNIKGQVVGQSTTAGDAEAHAFSWTPSGGMRDLGTLGGTVSLAVAVNNNGQVVGFSTTTGDVETHAFSWTPLDGMRDLGTLGGLYSVPTAESNVNQNDISWASGYSSLPGDAIYHAVL